jgi:GNAT superfamily N-acetyltransferase
MDELLAGNGTIRKLWLGETRKYRDHLLRLDENSRRRRFGGNVSDQHIRNHVEGTKGFDAILHGYFVDGILRGAAELRFLGTRLMSREAEVAFSVETPWQSHGIGSALLERTLLAARNRGIKFLHMACLADNKRMQQLARKFDAELSFDFGGVVGELMAPRATPLSLMREMISDGQSVATAMLEAQSQMLKPG